VNRLVEMESYSVYRSLISARVSNWFGLSATATWGKNIAFKITDYIVEQVQGLKMISVKVSHWKNWIYCTVYNNSLINLFEHDIHYSSQIIAIDFLEDVQVFLQKPCVPKGCQCHLYQY